MRSGEPTVQIDLSRFASRVEQLAAEIPDEDGLAEAVKEEMGPLIETASKRMAELLLRGGPRYTRDIGRFRSQFESRLRRGWKRPLELYDVVLAFATELGERANERCGPRAAEPKDFVFAALARLHGRACLTASEIGALLRTGHATGANARWRTLHEIAVTAFFIAEHGQDVAERYLAHDVVACYRSALQIQQYAEQPGEDVDAGELRTLETGTANMVARFGEPFKREWGWAAHALGRDKPTSRVSFSDIARATNMSHWAPYVRMASHGVHAGPRGGFFDIGLPDGLAGIPARPSHFGLADPGGNALISLGQATVTLLNHCLSLDGIENGNIAGVGAEDPDLAPRLVQGIIEIAEMRTLLKLIDEGDSLFLEVHKDMETAELSFSDAPRLWEAPRIEGLPNQ